jgi:small subunit ribosomal protein S1
LAERHVEIPEQVVAVDDELFVKIIDIDLERRRISLSLKQANEGHEIEIEAFDPTQYGMAARYDAEGNFIYPEGFDSDSQEWKPGYETQREEWEKQYAQAQERFMAHKKQKSEAKVADAAATPAEGAEEVVAAE